MTEEQLSHGSEVAPLGSAPPANLPVPQEILEKLPPQTRHEIEAFFAAGTWGPMPNPVAAKITPEHITKLLEVHGQENEREYSDRRDSRHWAVVSALLAIVALGGFVLALVGLGQTSLAGEFVKLAIAFGGGVGGGYGLSEWRRRQ